MLKLPQGTDFSHASSTMKALTFQSGRIWKHLRMSYSSHIAISSDVFCDATTHAIGTSLCCSTNATSVYN